MTKPSSMPKLSSRIFASGARQFVVHEAQLITTEKDWVRLTHAGEQQEALREASKVLQVELEFENPKLVELALQETITRAAERRASRK